MFIGGKGCTLEIYTADGGEVYTLHFHTRLLMVLNFFNDVEKSYVNAGMPRKS
jgi:hypothetical protein